MLNIFCCGYALGMATVGVAIILVDNYLNPKTDRPEIKMPPKMAAHFERKAKKMQSKHKPVREAKPKAEEPKPVTEIKTVPMMELFKPVIETAEPVVEEEETYTLDEILAEFM